MFEILAVLLGMGALGWAFGAFDQGSDDEQEEEDRHVVGPEDTIDTGDGNDTVTSGPDGAYGLLLSTGTGDDLVRLTPNPTGDVTVNGGDGNDTIESVHTGSYYGDGGDDVITAQGSDTFVYGANGNDTLTISRPGIHGNQAYGGNGADLLTAEVAVDQDLYNGGALLNGGEGEDTLTFRIIGVNDPATDPDDPEFGTIQRIGVVNGFDPAQDDLIIDLTELGASDATLASMQLNGTVLTLIFDNGARATVGLTGLPADSGFTVDDIQVLGTTVNQSITVTERGTTVEAGLGNDTISASNDDDIGNSQIFGGSGNDAMNFSTREAHDDGYALFGGQGQDRINGSGSNISIDGGDGADVVNLHGSAAVAYGGAGNDMVIGTNYAENIFGPTRIDGGDGDDTMVGLGVHAYLTANGISMTGGAGNDVFEISNIGYGPAANPDNPDFQPVWDFGSITDFNPAEDHLVVDADSPLSLDGVNLILSAAGSGLPSYIVLDFAGGTSSRIALQGIDASSGLQLSDIELRREDLGEDD